MLTACFITGTVMMKMMSSTSMTSTSGVMLISFITSSVSSCVPKAMALSSALLHRDDVRCPARGHPRARHEVGVQVVREAVEPHDHRLVAAHQRVVAQHGRNGDGEAERGHDQRLTDRTRDLVDRGLARGADGHQRVVNAPHRAEQADEGG